MSECRALTIAPPRSPGLSFPSCLLHLCAATTGPGNTVLGVSRGSREMLGCQVSARVAGVSRCCSEVGTQVGGSGRHESGCREWVAGVPSLLEPVGQSDETGRPGPVDGC